MTIYKSSWLIQAKYITYGAFGGAAMGIVSSWFFDPWFNITAGAVILAVTICLVLFRYSITVVVDDETFTVLQREKEKYRFNLSDVTFTANTSRRNNDDFLLTVYPSNSRRKHIDCAMLGKRRFEKLLIQLGVKGAKPPC